MLIILNYGTSVILACNILILCCTPRFIDNAVDTGKTINFVLINVNARIDHVNINPLKQNMEEITQWIFFLWNLVTMIHSYDVSSQN